MMPLPTMISPPQSPGCRSPAGRLEVNTIGFAAVPTARIFAPRSTKSAELGSPSMRVPSSMVSVAPLATCTKAPSTYTVSLSKRRLLVMSVLSVTTGRFSSVTACAPADRGDAVAVPARGLQPRVGERRALRGAHGGEGGRGAGGALHLVAGGAGHGVEGHGHRGGAAGGHRRPGGRAREPRPKPPRKARNHHSPKKGWKGRWAPLFRVPP